MPSGNSCRQTSVSTHLARFRRAVWKKVSRTFTCCYRPRVDRDAVCDEYISLPDATSTTPNLSSKYGPHPGHMTPRNNKSGAQHQSPEVILNIIRRSPHSHKTLRNTWVASNNSGPQSHVTLTTFAKDQTYPLSKATPDKITRDFSVASTSLGALSFLCRTPEGGFPPIASSGNLPLPCTSLSEVPTFSTLYQMLVSSTSSEEALTHPASSGALFCSYIFSGKAFTLSLSYEVLPFREVCNSSTSSGGLFFTCTPSGDEHTPLTSSGALRLSFRESCARELCTPLTSSVTLCVSCTLSGKAIFTLSTSSETLFFLCKSLEEAASPSTSFESWLFFYTSPGKVFTTPASSGTLPFSCASPGRVLRPSKSSGALQFPFKTTREVFSPSTTSGASSFLSTPHGKVFHPSKSYGLLSLPCRTHGDLFTPLTSSGVLPFPCTSFGLIFSPSSSGALPVSCISSRKAINPSTSNGNWSCPCTSLVKVIPTSASCGVLVFSCTSSGKAFTNSALSEELSFNYTSPAEVSTPSNSSGAFTFPHRTPEEKIAPSTSSGAFCFPYRSPGKVSTSTSASPKALPLPSRTPDGVLALSTSSGVLLLPCRAHGWIVTPSTSSGVVFLSFTSPQRVFSPSKSSGVLPTTCTSLGEVLMPSTSSGAFSVPSRSHREPCDPPTTSGAFSFPCTSSGQLFPPPTSSKARLASCIPSLEAFNPSTSFGNWQCPRKSPEEVVTPLTPSNALSFPCRSPGEVFIPSNSSETFTCSINLTSSREELTPLTSSRVFSSPLTALIPATPFKGFQSSCKIMTDTYSVSTPCEQLFTRSVPVKSRVSMALAATGLHFTSLVTGKTISTSQRTQPRSKISKRGLPCLLPSLHSETSSQAEVWDIEGFGCKGSFSSSRNGPEFDKCYNFANHTNLRPKERLLLSFNWVSEDEYLDQNIKSHSLPMCANSSSSEKASPAKYLIFASSLPALIGGEGFIQQTASCQSECFILSDSTVFSNASHQKLTPSYHILVSHQGFSFASGYSASWDNWGSFNTSSGFIPSARPLTLSWSCDGLNDRHQLDQKIRLQSLPVDVSGKDDRVADSKFPKAALSLPVIDREDKCPENTASFNSGCFNLSRSSIATNLGSRRTLDLTMSFQKDTWSSCSAGDGNLGRTASSLSACFNVSDTTISTASPKDAQQFLSNLDSNPQANPSYDVISSQGTSRSNHSKSADRFPSKATGRHETSNHHPKPRKETCNSGQRPQAAGPVIGLGDAPHLVNNILKGLSVEGNHQTFKSVPPTCPIIQPLDLTGVPDKRNRPTILGEGSFGVVQLVKHMPTMKLCAVKIPKEDLKRDRMYENFYREVNVLSSLRGLDCVPQLFGVSRAGSNLDMPILVQEFIGDPFTYDSITLQSAILKKVLSSWKATCIALQVCNGVREIHSRGILHCDLKVDNIMLLPGFIDAKYPKIKIIDFGMAVTLNGPPRYEIVPGQYLDEVGKRCLHVAPEVLRGQRPYSLASEIYGLGLILKNLSVLSGKYPEDLGQKCMGQEGTRPQLKDIINSLESKVSSHYNPPLSFILDLLYDNIFSFFKKAKQLKRITCCNHDMLLQQLFHVCPM